jgi:hypothetical protein
VPDSRASRRVERISVCSSRVKHSIIARCFPRSCTAGLKCNDTAFNLDVGFPESSLLFAARSSPFVCVADALETMVLLCMYLYQGHNIRQAARHINWRQAKIRLGSEITTLEGSAGEKHPKTFLILFIVTFLQAIKFLGRKAYFGRKYWQEFIFAPMLSSLLFDFSRQSTGGTILLPHHLKRNRRLKRDCCTT